MSATTVKRTEQQRARRNLNPHKPAVAAMYLWGSRYAAQGGGSMDFWDTLRDSQRDLCRRLVARIEEAPAEASHVG